jgi:hypothetical protein
MSLATGNAETREMTASLRVISMDMKKRLRRKTLNMNLALLRIVYNEHLVNANML